MAAGQLRRQRLGHLGDDLLPVGGAFVPEDLLTQPLADLPVEGDQLAVHRLRDATAGRLDQRAQLLDEGIGGWDELVGHERSEVEPDESGPAQSKPLV